ncbi:cytochrome c oxidase assembly protein [Photobacterium halotolerans]|uniref:Cytochrome c oxidase assembly protein CtaG n=1 Tax=Photobacterium halotolerans TaxID=265726 RepID=A0A7X5BLK1_9GAMM|nr:cytochrome c oxidase assembly protein [Photobacterium halotolerans]NAW65725.1 cytochrome c oxidase assembly protein [Photobacterium halotolerans]NAX45576.1 cytochrome c oxidase assembly protein [Photobacterium halotolerans]
MADTDKEKGKKKSLLSLILLSLGMFGFAFALVPLYDVFCEVTGINGKTSNQAAIASEQVDDKRTVTVEFMAYINPGMAWRFEPEVTRLVVHPGETYKVLYSAQNLTQTATVGQAVPSVSPGLGAQYFNKIECFCFNRQPLAAGASAELPLLFYIDPKLPEDINTLTLAYTLFNAQPEPAAQTQ